MDETPPVRQPMNARLVTVAVQHPKVPIALLVVLLVTVGAALLIVGVADELAALDVAGYGTVDRIANGRVPIGFR